MPVQFKDDVIKESNSSPALNCASSVTGPKCMKCQKGAIEYKTDTCQHSLFCKSCAMKCATGGKCKICGTFYGSFTHID